MGKVTRIDVYDVVLFSLIGAMTYIEYILPTIAIQTSPLWLQFIIKITDATYGFLIIALVFKKVLEKSSKK